MIDDFINFQNAEIKIISVNDYEKIACLENFLHSYAYPFYFPSLDEEMGICEGIRYLLKRKNEGRIRKN